MVPVQVKCLRTVADDEMVYAIKGKTYEVFLLSGDEILIETEDPDTVFPVYPDDEDFLILYEED